MSYGIVESTECSGRLFSFQSTTDMENGAVVKMGALQTGEADIYVGDVPAVGDRVFLVDNPAWSYEREYATYQNEDNFINKAGIPYRVRELKVLDKFKVTDYSIAPIDDDTALAVGQLVVVDGTTNKLKAVASSTTVTTYGFVGEIEAIETLGFPYCVGSLGTSDSTYGYNVSTAKTRVKIKVVKNA